MHNKICCRKAWPIAIVVIALILGVLASVWSQEHLENIVFISRFFDVMLPILAVGALIKYLFSGKSKPCCCCGACKPKGEK